MPEGMNVTLPKKGASTAVERHALNEVNPSYHSSAVEAESLAGY